MKLTNFKFLATIMMLFISFMSIAQVDPPADDDPPLAPINTKLIWLTIIGIAFMFYYFKNRKNLSNNN